MIIRALGWSTVSSLLGIVVQIVVLAVLARLLSATEFGLIAASTLVTRFVTYFARAGLGESLIRRREISPEHCTAALVIAGVVGMTMWAILALLSGPFAQLFREPELRSLLLFSPASIVLGSLASVPLAILRRGFRFKAFGAIELFGLLVGYGFVGIALAKAGYGVWSIVVGTVAQQVLVLGGALVASRSQIWAVPKRQHYSDLFAYGSRYSLVSFLDFLSSTVEAVFTGRFLGMGNLGVMNRVSAITSLPLELLMSSIQRVAFPAMARLSGDSARLGAAMRLSMTLMSLLTVPAAFAIAMLSDDLVGVVLGANWSSAVPVVQVYAWALPALHLSVVAGSTIDVLGVFRLKAIVILFIILIKVALLCAFGWDGLIWVVATMVVAEWARAALLVGLACYCLEVRIPEVVSRLVFGVLIGLSTGAAVAVTATALSHSAFAGMPRSWSTGAQLFVAAVVFFLAVRIALRRILGLEAGSGLDLSNLKRLARI